MAYKQLVDNHGLPTTQRPKVFSMIDNYIYLYHTKTLIAIPTFPETIADNIATTFTPSTPLARSAPIYSFTSAGPRSFQVSLALHRDLMNEINVSTSMLKIDNLDDEDYVDRLINELHGIALPRYGESEKMVDPPVVAVRFGNDIFCKGIVDGGITVTYSGPILRTNKYAQVGIDFNIKEIDPYDASTVMMAGGFRGLNAEVESLVSR